jgi:hypothetical protein
MNFYMYKSEILNRSDRGHKNGASLKLVGRSEDEEEQKLLVADSSSWTIPLIVILLASLMINALFGYRFLKNRDENYSVAASEPPVEPSLGPHHFEGGEDIELAEVRARDERTN